MILKILLWKCAIRKHSIYLRRDLNGIDLQKLVHRRTGDTIKDLNYDLEHPDEIGIFQTLIENVKENLNWIWNSFSRQDQIEFDKRFTKIIQLNSNPMPPRTAKLIKQLIKMVH